MTAGELLREAESRLVAARVEQPRLEAELIVGRALELSRTRLYAEPELELEGEEEAATLALLERRAAREPLAYVLGEWGFRRLLLKTDRRALVPRPETEVLVERALALIAGESAPRVLDIGTGSGAIALAILDEHPGASVVALDSSADALSLARDNAEALALTERISFLQADALQADVFGEIGGPFELVVSNPPYVLPEEIDELEVEVREWEPRAALVGTGVPERVAELARELLVAGGGLAVELGLGQTTAYAARLRSLGFVDALITPDLTGRDRVVEARWSGAAQSAR